MSPIDRVLEHERRRPLFQSGESVVVALSGGADSVFLLHAMRAVASAKELTLAVVHVNHGLRGADSDGDERFVAGIASTLGLPIFIERHDVRAVAAARRQSIEPAGRDVRYECFRRACARASADAVVTGHTRDDQVETVLMRLFRGAGARGLCGMADTSQRDGYRLIRPLLDTTKAEIVTWLRSNGIDWREDSSNADGHFFRNRIRNELVPRVIEIAGRGALDNVARAAEILRDEDDWMNRCALDALLGLRCDDDSSSLDLARLRELHPALRRRTLQLWLANDVLNAAPSYDDIVAADALTLDGAPTSGRELSNGIVLRRAYGRLFTAGTDAEAFDHTLPAPGRMTLHPPGIEVDIAIEPGLVRDVPASPGALPACASLQWNAALPERIRIRSWQPGDAMRPLGFGGRRKLQDIFSDARVPRHERGRVPIIEVDGEIVWIPGYRIAEGRQVTNAERPALQIRIKALPQANR